MISTAGKMSRLAKGKPMTAKILAGLAVAAALLGLGGTAYAQSNIISFQLNASYTNTTSSTWTLDGVPYSSHGIVTVSQFYMLDLTQSGTGNSTGCTSYEIISTSTTNIITSLEPVLWNRATFSGGNVVMNVGGSVSPYSMGFGLQAVANYIAPGFVLGSPPSNYQQFFDYINAHGTLTTAYISDNSDGFTINSINMIVVSQSSTNISLNSVGFTNGQFGFSVAGPTGSNVLVQASTNLQDWIPLATNTLASGTNYFSDTTYTNFSRRFYRVRTQ